MIISSNGAWRVIKLTKNLLLCKNEMEISGAIFNFDGTLFDSMPIWKGLKYKFFDKIGLELTKEDEEAFNGLYLKESLIMTKERFNLNDSYDELLS